jgi:hypothetical protein
MSKFKWDVTDVGDDAVPGSHGGSVKIDNLNPVTDGSTWKVETPDMSLELLQQSGGTVVLSKKPAVEAKTGKKQIVSRKTVDFVIQFFAIMLGLSFFLVVANDVVFGSLTFQGFMSQIGLFLGGLGIGKFMKSKGSD